LISAIKPIRRKAMYNFSVYTFSDKEIDQICELVKKWGRGDIYLPIDARRFTKQVKEYALNWRLLEKRNGRLFLKSSSSWYNSTPGLFNVRYLPTEAQWRLVEPMLRTDGSTGYSIVNNKLWENLGITPQNNKHATEQDLCEKEDILLELSGHHYINFLMAGSVWRIYTEERQAA
jgi:hypothetical protein